MSVFYRYDMASSDDYRGEVKLIERVNGVDVAYTTTTTPDNDMLPLSPNELRSVEEKTGGLWIGAVKQYLVDIDVEADLVRKSYMDIGKDTIDTEYQQVKEAFQEWKRNGSDLSNVPDEITCWAQATGETVEWAIADVEREMDLHRQMIMGVRAVRLKGKVDIKQADAEQAKQIRDTVVTQLRSMRKTGFDH